MKLQEVNQCCCGCSLETGTKIIGWLQIIGALVYLSVGVLDTVYNISGGPCEGTYGDTFLLYLSNGLIMLGFAIALLIGTAKRRPDYINTWVIASIIGIIMFAINSLAEASRSMAIGTDKSVSTPVVTAVMLPVVAGLNYYCLVVVGSFHKEILSGNSGV